MPPVCPSSGERGGTRGHGVGRDGMTNPRRIKALAGNSASCLGFSIALPTGSNPVASIHGCGRHHKPFKPALSQACFASSVKQ
ncbi:hypothetical protein DAT35_03070 [Vitiosangium sp. GDMCC 1.1324]|nr:hypothetical protein DAT35_03070 [Vitiosangium sp. GDMCC 1.1324]